MRHIKSPGALAEVDLSAPGVHAAQRNPNEDGLNAAIAYARTLLASTSDDCDGKMINLARQFLRARGLSEV